MLHASWGPGSLMSDGTRTAVVCAGRDTGSVSSSGPWAHRCALGPSSQLRATQYRVRDPVAVWLRSWALSLRTLRDACDGVRLATLSRLGEHPLAASACSSANRSDVEKICMCIVLCSAMWCFSEEEKHAMMIASMCTVRPCISPCHSRSFKFYQRTPYFGTCPPLRIVRICLSLIHI